MKPEETTARARSLRKVWPEPERKLWGILHPIRQRGHHFRRQHPIGPYFADFACVKAKLVVEADGATHSTDTEIAYDTARTAFIEAEGFRVLRFWNNDIMMNPDGVFIAIEAALRGHEPGAPAQSRQVRLRRFRSGLAELAKRTGQ